MRVEGLWAGLQVEIRNTFFLDISPLQRQEFSPSPTVTVSSKVILG